jgi:methionyl-tRNA formyltransferase
MIKGIVIFTKEIYFKSIMKSLKKCGLDQEIAYIVYSDKKDTIFESDFQKVKSSIKVEVIAYSDFEKKVFRDKLVFNLGISFMFSQIFREEIFSIFNKGIINFHPSLLPLNRGSHPISWAIFNETRHGITAHLVDLNIDSGPILKQKEILMRFDHTAEKLYFESIHEMEQLVAEVVPSWLSSETNPKAQGGGASQVNRIEDLKSIKVKNISEINDVDEFLKLLRAASFSPKDGLRLKIVDKEFDLYLKIERVDGN